jgi:8-oxo-dGTP pyrophosphatase MutT (NUDIX family)
MDRIQLLQALSAYSTEDGTEQQFIARFKALLQHPDAFQRSHLPGHITGSAWISDEQNNNVLLTHHAKLNKWLQPGGHADGDEHVIRVASREAEEETGIKEFSFVTGGIFDLDIHVIPARGDMPEHLHYDIRYWLRASSQLPLMVTEESHALRWVPLSELGVLCQGNESIMRMVRNMDKLF